MRELLEGDILWGSFPMDSGIGKAIHPALVILVKGGIPIALIGTSENVPPRSGPDGLVLAPTGKPSRDTDWRLTGLAVPTRFSTNARVFPVAGSHGAVLIGTIRPYRPGSGKAEWHVAAKRLSSITEARLPTLIRAWRSTRA